MNQISFQAFALRAQSSSPGGVNLKPVGGPSGAGGLPVCATRKKRRKPLPVDQLPLPLGGAVAPIEVRDDPLYWHGSYASHLSPDFYDAFGCYVNPMDAPSRLPYGATWAADTSDGSRLAYGGVPR